MIGPVAFIEIAPRQDWNAPGLEVIRGNIVERCGGALVDPGDIILADEIGVVAVPRKEAAEVLRRALLQAEQEEATRQRIKSGKTVDELLAEFGRL